MSYQSVNLNQFINIHLEDGGEIIINLNDIKKIGRDPEGVFYIDFFNGPENELVGAKISEKEFGRLKDILV